MPTKNDGWLMIVSNQVSDTVDGRNPAPPGMIESL